MTYIRGFTVYLYVYMHVYMYMIYINIMERNMFKHAYLYVNFAVAQRQKLLTILLISLLIYIVCCNGLAGIIYIYILFVVMVWRQSYMYILVL